jgi:predicted transcriptional regulator YdeE
MNFHTLIVTIAAIALPGLVSLQGEHEHAKPKVVDEPSFTVIGISARTTNAKEMSGQGMIGKMWERVMKQGVLNAIPNRIDSNTLAIYTDYESDANGAYTFLIGAKVSSAKEIPAGMIAVNVPAGKYARFISDPGPAARVVPETWSRIWSSPKSVLGDDRAYKADFELYGSRAADPQHARVEIFVGIK